MGKHRSDETSTSAKSRSKFFTGRHDAGEAGTIPLRADLDADGRLIGFGVGRGDGPGDEHYDR